MSVTNSVCPVALSRDQATKQPSNQATGERADAGEAQTDLFSHVESALMDAPQFAKSGINSRLLATVVRDFLPLMAPELILVEANQAKAWLHRHSGRSYTDAPGFFRKWLKRAEVEHRTRPPTKVQPRGLIDTKTEFLKGIRANG
jgi:hypothetical protein